MMKTRNLAIIAVIIIILAAVSFMQKNSHQKTTSRSVTTALIESEWSTTTIGKITVGTGSDDAVVSLVKNPDQSWTVGSAWNAPGDAEKIGNLLFNLVGLKGEFRSDNAAVLKDYKLDKAQAVSLRGYGNDGEMAFEILVGTMPAGARGNFVRLPSDNRVHLTQKNLLAPLGLYGEARQPLNKNFIKLHPLAMDKLAVNGIVLENEGQTIRLVKVFSEGIRPEGEPAPAPDRTTWEWKLADDSAVALAKTKVDALMNSVISLRAADVDDPAADAEGYGLQNPARTVTVLLEDGSRQVLAFGSPRPAGNGGSSASTLPAGRWLSVEGKNEIWIVTDLTVSNIFKNVDELKAE